MKLSEPRRTQLLTGILLVTIFAAGVVTGAGVGRIGRPPLGPPGPLPLRELDLTAEQERAAHQIMERYRPQFEAVVRESFPKVRALGVQMESEIRTLLTPEQQQRLSQLKARRPPHAPRPPLGAGPRLNDLGPAPAHLSPVPPLFAPGPGNGPDGSGSTAPAERAPGLEPQPRPGEPPPSTSP